MRRLFLLAWVITSVGLFVGPRSSGWAFSLENQRWTSSPVVLQLQLDTSPPGRTLLDGSTTWWQVAETALSEWNAVIANLQFSSVRNSTVALGAPNGVNNVFFGSTIYGDSWGSGVLAVTITYTSGLRRVESDVVFKASLPWDSYRGSLRSVPDFKRVALHEFGHVLGLNHPDEIGQTVTALMNSTVSNLDALAADDVAGAQAAYGAPGGLQLPTITSITRDQSVTLGGTARFAVSASGTPPLSYQWRKDGGTLSGATNTTLTLEAVQFPDAGSYTVLVTNAAGSVTSSPSVLTVTVPPPTLISQPTSRTVVAGASVSFSVAASGFGALSYQWARNGVALTGATLPTLTLENVQLNQAGDYAATVTNAGGSVASNVATLTVQPPPSLPVIANQPTGQSIAVGGTVALSVVASGAGTLSYVWQKNGAPVVGATAASLTIPNAQVADSGTYTVVVSNPSGSVTSSPVTVVVSASLSPPVVVTPPVAATVPLGAPVSFTVVANGSAPLTFAWRRNGALIPGAGAAVLSIVSAQESDAGSYTVTVSNGAGSVTTSPVTLSIDGPMTAPRISAMPISQTVVVDSPVTFSVTATGTPPFDYQWFKDGALLSGASGASLSLPAAKLSDAGSYTVRVTNAAGSVTSDPAVLVVQALATVPVIITPPSAVTSSVGTPASFSVVADGAPPLTYAWRREGTLIANATRSTLVLGSVQVADAGNYTVTVSNALGSVTSPPASLTVVVPSLPPLVLVQPVGVVTTVGGTASFGVTVRGTAPLSYQWRKEGVPLAGATQATLTLTNVRATDAALYSVEITNAFGAAVSASARLTVNPAPAPPQIDAPPTARTVTEGVTVSLSVTASGVGPLTYRWLKGGIPIAGATSATLTFSPVRLTDAGSYSVAVTNTVGTVTTSPVELTVNSSVLPPTITVQPAGRSLMAGDSLALNVAVSGTSPFTYRWRRNGDPISGATAASYAVAQVGEGDAGSYTVEVSNAAGAVVSAAAVVLVAPKPSARITNVSIRTPLAVGQTLIVGLSMSGGAKPVLVRAVGPGLSPFGVNDAMADPRLTLYRGAVVEGANDDWGGGATQASVFASAGAFALPPGSRDAALVAMIEGGRTVQVVGAAAGTVLVEAYDTGTGDFPRLVNVSARNRVSGSSEPLIAGFTLVGNAPRTILIRGVGPTLASFGVLGALSDPQLELYSGATKINENDNWANALSATFGTVGAFSLVPGGRDAVLLVTLAPGGYTVQVSGVGGAVGDALIELYEVNSP
jgi:hypothetical protein